MVKFRGRTTFNVPGQANQYAQESITFDTTVAGGGCAEIDAVTVLAFYGTTAPTGAVVELWLPVVGPSARPVPDAEYVNTGLALTGNGGTTWPLAAWRGARLRVRSAGVAGTLDVSATGD